MTPPAKTLRPGYAEAPADEDSLLVASARSRSCKSAVGLPLPASPAGTCETVVVLPGDKLEGRRKWFRPNLTNPLTSLDTKNESSPGGLLRSLVTGKHTCQSVRLHL